jgi:hypothetical protein
MKRQITQFDNDRNNATVATPTCSSCCCCCCCLTTTLASSTILARRINQEARQKKIKDPVGLTVLAALFLPVIAGITYLLTFAINKHFGQCIQQTYDNGFGGNNSYQYCSTPASNLYVLIPIALIVAILVLSYLYVRVKMVKPVLRAVIVTAIVVSAFVAEGVGGAMLILTGFGGIIYLIAIPILFSAVQRFYSRKILHKTILGNAITNA